MTSSNPESREQLEGLALNIQYSTIYFQHREKKQNEGARTLTSAWRSRRVRAIRSKSKVPQAAHNPCAPTGDMSDKVDIANPIVT
jgi:hypothetical protein